MSFEDIITAAYRGVLSRQPDPDGLKNYRETLSGLSSSAIMERAISSLLKSEEFQRKWMSTAPVLSGPTKESDVAASRAEAPSRIRYFHSFDLGDGEVIRGEKPLAALRREAETIFSEPIRGKTVIDIGAWDGYFAFEAEKRGALDVLATDHVCWSGPGWGTKAGFEYVHAKLGSRVRSLDIDVFALDPNVLGAFDVCLFLGVLYHLQDPFGGMKQVFRMTRELAVIETEVTELRNANPVLRFYEGAALNNDASNFFAPNHACLEAMLREVGFKRFKFTPREHPPEAINGRTIVHAWK